MEVLQIQQQLKKSQKDENQRHQSRVSLFLHQTVQVAVEQVEAIVKRIQQS